MKKHRSRFTGIGLTIALLAGAILFAQGDGYFGQAEGFSGVSRTSIGYNRVSGPSKNSSFLDRGAVWNSEADIRYNDKLGDLKLNIDSTFRYANDTAIDPEHKLRMLKLSVDLILDHPEKVRELTLGDFYANLSQYTFSQSAKGVRFHAKYGDQNQYDVIAFAGAIKPNWHDFLGTSTGEPQTRYVTGARLEHRYSRTLTYGLNYAYLRDDSASGDSAITRADRNQVLSLDFRYRPVRWYRLDGEVAYARSSAKTSSTIPGVASTSGHAIRLKNYFTVEKMRINADFERVGTDFNTLGGAATPDRKQYTLRVRRPLGERADVMAGWRFYRDNLNGKNPVGTTYVQNPELRFNYQPLAERRSLNTYLGWRDRRSIRGDGSNKRITRTFTAGLSDRVGNADYNISLERRLFTEYDNSALDTKSWRLSTRAGYKLTAMGAELYPHLDVSTNWQRNRRTQDKTHNVIVGGGLRGTVGEEWRFSALYRRDDFDDLDPAQTNDTVRDTVTLAVTRVFGEKRNEISLNYRKMKFDHEVAVNEYREEQLWLELLFNF